MPRLGVDILVCRMRISPRERVPFVAPQVQAILPGHWPVWIVRLLAGSNRYGPKRQISPMLRVPLVAS
jgi:hypothetical protein